MDCIVVVDLVVAGDGGFGGCWERERERERERVEISVKLFSQAASCLGVLVVTAVLHAVLYLLLFVV